MKRKLSIRLNFFLTCLLSTMLMAVQGISGMFGASRPTNLITAFLDFSFVAVVLLRLRAEPLDELAHKNMGKAAYGTIILTLCVCICVIFYLNIKEQKVILIPAYLFFAMGIIFFSFGTQFFIFDKWGKT